MELNELTYKIIGCAYDVHKALGPGLLESTYEITYLKLSQKQLGLLINFNVTNLQNGIRRYKI